MAPAVAEAPEVWGTASFVRPKRDGNFRHANAHGGCLYDELRGKLHTGGSQIHPSIDGFSKAAHAAVGVSDICAEKQFQDSRKHGVADLFMMPSHRARFDFSFEAIAHHNFIAFAPFCAKARHLREIIAVIGIAHDDELSARLFNSLAQCMTVAPRRGMNNSGAVLLGDFDRTVSGSIIRDDDFAMNACFFEGSNGLVDAKCDGLRLVETRNNYEDVKSLMQRLITRPSAFEGGSFHQPFLFRCKSPVRIAAPTPVRCSCLNRVTGYSSATAVDPSLELSFTITTSGAGLNSNLRRSRANSDSL